MSDPFANKSTISEIRARFDADVERFSNLETGQSATIDAPLAMELITRAAAACCPDATRILDIGCGAGNNAIKLLQTLDGTQACDLVDLSQPMLDRAHERVSAETSGEVRILAGDFREVDLEEGVYDIVVAAAVLHHLRDVDDWRAAFSKVFRLLKPGGSFWISDLVCHELASVDELMWRRYRSYLESLGGADYADEVMRYIDKEDSPRPVTFQLRLLQEVGFSQVDLLHKNSCFAAFGGMKLGRS